MVLAAVLGAILVVTGPTVIGPLLRHMRLGGQIGSLLKWEGILIDPVGAVLAVLVFTAVRSGGLRQAAGPVFHDFLMTALVGVGLGVAGAAALVALLGRYWIPDSLQNPAVLATVFGVFGLAHLAPGDGGLIAVTVMGIVLANQALGEHSAFDRVQGESDGAPDLVPVSRALGAARAPRSGEP